MEKDSDFMEILGVLLYVLNILLCGFSFNQVKTEQQKQLIANGVIFLVIAISSVVLYLPGYLIESLLMSIIGGATLVFTPGMTPDFLYRKVKLFNIVCALSVALFVIVFLVSFICIELY